MSPDRTALISLLDEFGLYSFPRHRDGYSVYIAPYGKPTSYSGTSFPVDHTTATEMDRLIEVLDALAAEIGAEAPWEHAKARELDTVSFEQWLGRLRPRRVTQIR